MIDHSQLNVALTAGQELRLEYDDEAIVAAYIWFGPGIRDRVGLEMFKDYRARGLLQEMVKNQIYIAAPDFRERIQSD